MELNAVAGLCVLVVFLVAMVKISGIRQDVGEIKNLLKKQIGEKDESKPKASPAPFTIKNKEPTKIENLIVFIDCVLLFFAVCLFFTRIQK